MALEDNATPVTRRSMFKYGSEEEGCAGTTNQNDVVNSLLQAEFTRTPNSNCLTGWIKSDGSYDLGAEAIQPMGVGSEFKGKAYKSACHRTTNANPDPGGGF